jgi:DNA-binding response OmpR family regulator
VLTLEPSARRLRLGSRELDLTTTEYEILSRLVVSAGHVVSRDELMAGVFGRDVDPADRALDVHISHVRQKLGSHRALILTVRGAGYMFRLEPASANGVLTNLHER